MLAIGNNAFSEQEVLAAFYGADVQYVFRFGLWLLRALKVRGFYGLMTNAL